VLVEGYGRNVPRARALRKPKSTINSVASTINVGHLGAEVYPSS
jgi:hypothetical protein